MVLSNRYICMAFSAFMVMSFFIYPVSAEEYQEDFNYYEDVPVDEPSEEIFETEYILTEEVPETSAETSETYLIETTIPEFQKQLTTYITAGAIKIVGEYYGVEVPDFVAVKIAEEIQPFITSDYNTVSISTYAAEKIVQVVTEYLGTAPDGFENAVKEYTYDIFEENNPSEFNYYVPIFLVLSFISTILLLIWIGI